MSSQPFTIATVSVALFAATFLYGVVVPVLPFMLENRLRIPHEDIQYYCSLSLANYSAASFAFSPVAGTIADRVTRRKGPFQLSCLILIAVVLTFFTTKSIVVLSLARTLQGFGTAVLWTLSFTICYNAVGPERIGQTFGTMLSFSDFGAFFSPAFGGFLYSRYGIGSIMVACLFVLTVALVSSTFLVETTIEKAFDPEESSQISSEEDPLLPKPATRHDYILPSGNNKIFDLAPILRCFCKPNFSIAILLCVLYGGQLAAFDATVPLEARRLFGFEPLDSGFLFVPIAFARLIAGPVGGYLVDKYNPRFVAILGYLFLIPIYSSFRFIGPEPRQMEIVVYSLLLSLSGVGTALVASTSIVESSTLVGKYHSANPELFGPEAPIGSLNGIYLAAFGIGASLGAMGAGSLRNSFGYGNMNAFMAAIAAFAALISSVWLERLPSQKKVSIVRVEVSDS